jgi:hypothetical protein
MLQASLFDLLLPALPVCSLHMLLRPPPGFCLVPTAAAAAAGEPCICLRGAFCKAAEPALPVVAYKAEMKPRAAAVLVVEAAEGTVTSRWVTAEPR